MLLFMKHYHSVDCGVVFFECESSQGDIHFHSLLTSLHNVASCSIMAALNNFS